MSFVSVAQWYRVKQMLELRYLFVYCKATMFLIPYIVLILLVLLQAKRVKIRTDRSEHSVIHFCGITHTLHQLIASHGNKQNYEKVVRYVKSMPLEASVQSTCLKWLKNGIKDLSFSLREA